MVHLSATAQIDTASRRGAIWQRHLVENVLLGDDGVLDQVFVSVVHLDQAVAVRERLSVADRAGSVFKGAFNPAFVLVKCTGN